MFDKEAAMALLPIKTFPAEVLMKKAKPIETFDHKLQRLVDDMVETMLDAPGAGLAAPQIGVSKRVFVINGEYFDEPDTGRAFINPKIISMTEKSEFGEEGCLSLPGLWGDVERPFSIVAEALDTKGEVHQFELEDWVARVFQHEYDHLDGVLFPERMKGIKKRQVLRKLKKMVAAAE